MATEEVQESTEQASQSYGHPLTLVSSFNYLGRFLIDLYNYWPLVVGKIPKVQKKSACMLRILRRECTNVQRSGTLFKAVDQGVITYVLAPNRITP